MKIVALNEYLNPKWEEDGEYPSTCKRIYVDLDEDKPILNLTSKGSKTWRVGPFAGVKEASEWTMEHKELW